MNTKAWETADTMANAPPRLVFPNHPEPMAIVATSRQGNNEVHFDLWWSFWDGLSADAKLGYLREHNAPPA